MLSNKRLVAVCAIALCCNIAGLLLFARYKAREPCAVSVDAHRVLAELPDDFLSFGIDASEVPVEGRVPWGSRRLRALAAALRPARLRLGGTMSERLVFSRSAGPPADCRACTSTSGPYCAAVRSLCRHKFLPFFTMTGDTWSTINHFCQATGLKLLFSLNVLIRNDHKWNEMNALDLITYSKQKGFEVDWQLGNEPNSFPHTFNVSISPSMLGHDFSRLRHLLLSVGYNNSLVVGPDTTRPQHRRPECLHYMVQFLGNASRHIDVRSWHQYYLNSRTATLDDFWDPKTLDLLQEQIETMKNNTLQYNHIPMWLTETSSSYGGGAPGLSNSFAGSPLWLDKLGLAAAHNITTVVRQSLFGGNYSLLSADLDPLPDWWVSVLYKRLVGRRVLAAQCRCSPKQRFYAHCAARRHTDDRSAVTLYALNLEMASVTFQLTGAGMAGRELSVEEWIVTAPSHDRRSRTVLLNGWPLDGAPDAALPPRHRKRVTALRMPPYSIAFWVVSNTSMAVCNY